MKQTPVRAPFEPIEMDQPVVNRRTLSKQRTRQKLLLAARDLFVRNGYEAATVRDIAAAAGMSTGAVFANFQDKSDLFEAVLVEQSEQAAERMRTAASGDGDVDVRLLAVFAANLGPDNESLPLLRAIYARSWVRSPEEEIRARAAQKGLLSIVGDVLRDSARRDEIRQDFDVRLIAEMLWDAYVATLRRAIFDEWAPATLLVRLNDQIAVILAALRIK